MTATRQFYRQDLLHRVQAEFTPKNVQTRGASIRLPDKDPAANRMEPGRDAGRQRSFGHRLDGWRPGQCRVVEPSFGRALSTNCHPALTKGNIRPGWRGAGKSTCALPPGPSARRAWWQGAGTRKPAMKEQIGYMSQGFALCNDSRSWKSILRHLRCSADTHRPWTSYSLTATLAPFRATRGHLRAAARKTPFCPFILPGSTAR
jgi:hypothetical protein